jgi:hypothetical protein
MTPPNKSNIPITWWSECMAVITPNIPNIKPVKVIIIRIIINASLSTLYWLFYNHVRLGHSKHNKQYLFWKLQT